MDVIVEYIRGSTDLRSLYKLLQVFSQFGMSEDDLLELQTKIHTEELAIAKTVIEGSDELTRFRTQISDMPTREKFEHLLKTLTQVSFSQHERAREVIYTLNEQKAKLQKVELLSAHLPALGSEWDSVVGPLMGKIANNLVVSLNLCHCLMGKMLLSESEWQDIECQRTSRDKVHTLIWKYLSKRGPGSLESFCDALEALDLPNTHLSSLIREKRKTLMPFFFTQTEDLRSASHTSASSNNGEKCKPTADCTSIRVPTQQKFKPSPTLIPSYENRMRESSQESSYSNSRILDTNERDSTCLKKVIVHVDKTLEEEFKLYRTSVEGLIRSIYDVPEGEMQQIKVVVLFIDGMPFSKPSRQKEVRGCEPNVEISLQCVLRIFLPNTTTESFLAQKERLLSLISGLLHYKDIEILCGSCCVLLTLKGTNFVRFLSDFHNPRGLICLIQLDSDAEIQFRNIEPVKVAHLFRQSPLLLPVTKAVASIERCCGKARKQYSETFSRSRFFSVHYSLRVAKERLMCGLRMKEIQATLEETEKLQWKPSCGTALTDKLATLKTRLDKWSKTAKITQQKLIEADKLATLKTRLDKWSKTAKITKQKLIEANKLATLKARLDKLFFETAEEKQQKAIQAARSMLSSKTGKGLSISAESSRSVGPFDLRSPESRIVEPESGSGSSVGLSESGIFCDAVLPCNPWDLCRDLGEWRFRLHSGIDALKMKWLDGLTIGILGPYNTGKTWIISQLAGCDLPSQGMLFREEGLRFKWISTTGAKALYPSQHKHHHHHIVIDTTVLNTPRNLVGEIYKEKTYLQEANREMRQYEDFLHSITLQLSDFIIIVINELTRQDQLFLHSVTEKWSGLCQKSTAKLKDVFVIHNFRFTETAEEREDLFHKSTAEVYEGFTAIRGEYQTITFFHREQYQIDVWHVCLMQDRGAGKRYNEEVFSLLRGLINNMKLFKTDSRSPRQFAEDIGNSATASLRTSGFLRNIKEIKTEVQADELGAIRFIPIKAADNQPITKATQADHFYGISREFEPPTLVTTYRTVTGRPCKLVLLELPGNQIEICVQRNLRHLETKPGCCVVEVKGEKEMPRLLDILREELKNDVDKDAFFPADEAACEASERFLDADTCVYDLMSTKSPILNELTVAV